MEKGRGSDQPAIVPATEKFEHPLIAKHLQLLPDLLPDVLVHRKRAAEPGLKGIHLGK